MRVMKLLFFFAVYVVCIFSCASVAGKNILYVHLTDNSKFVLLPTEGIEQPMDMAQFLYRIQGSKLFFKFLGKSK